MTIRLSENFGAGCSRGFATSAAEDIHVRTTIAEAAAFFNAKRTDPCAPGSHATSGNVPIATLAFRCWLAHRGGCGVTSRGRVRVMPPRGAGAELDSARG